MIEGHGDDIFRYGNRIVANFSTNILQTVDHSRLMQHLFSEKNLFCNYPEPDASRVGALISRKLELPEASILVTGGATEAIYLLAQLFRGARSSIVVPTFREYQDACKIFSHKITFLNSITELSEDARMVWLCNPDNPTGLTYAPELLESFIRNHPEMIFVIDQAYKEYSVKEVLSLEKVREYPNLVILQSLTKRFSIPGLRIGYLVAHPDIIAGIKACKMPWSVNVIAIEAALYLLHHEADYIIPHLTLHSEALRIQKKFKESGISTYPTDCNFFLAELPDGKAADLKNWLVDNYGILIRDASNFEGLSQRHFRVAAQTPHLNNMLIEAVRKWMS